MRSASFVVPALLLALGQALSAQQKLKVYISVDMEGITGVVTDQQLGPAGFEYQRFREFMTQEALAAIQGARDAGATEIVISDSHGNGQNLLIERLPADVTIVRSWPRPLMMMQGIDSTFDAAIMIGYHSGTHNPMGVRAHTISSARLTGVELNGMPASESHLSAAIAGHFGVPVVMISGDDAAVSEAAAAFPGIEGAIVKRALSFHSAATLTPEAGQKLIRERVRTGIQKRAQLRPFVVRTPIRLDISFKSYRVPEILAYLPIVERPTAHTIRYTARSILDISRFIQFVTTYSIEIDP